MVSDKFMVNSEADRMAAARYATENFAWQAKLNRRDALRLDLLVEETLGMVKSMLQDFYGQIWFVSEGNTCEIHFEATANMDADKKEELLSVSSTGKNAAAKGFMGKLGDFISSTLYGIGRTMDFYGQQAIQYGIVHTPATMSGFDEMMPVWTLQAYKQGLEGAKGEDDADAALDELEKSIVARLADDVIVGVKGDRIDMVIVKKFD